MIWEIYENKDKKKARIIALIGAGLLIAVILLILPLYTFTVDRPKMIDWMQISLPKWIRPSEPEAPAEPKLERRKASARKVTRQMIRQLNLDAPAMVNQPKVLDQSRTTRKYDSQAVNRPQVQRGVESLQQHGAEKVEIQAGDRAGKREVGSGGLAGQGRSANRLNLGGGAPLGMGDIGKVDLGGKGQKISIPKAPPREEDIKRLSQSLNPIIEWIEKNQKLIPRTLHGPEAMNLLPGDVTTMVDFTTDDGRDYTLYLLGRKSSPPQLNIGLVTGMEIVILQDMGAKGVSESFRAGRVSDRFDEMVVATSLMPASDPRASEMMGIFYHWWNQVKK